MPSGLEDIYYDVVNNNVRPPIGTTSPPEGAETTHAAQPYYPHAILQRWNKGAPPYQHSSEGALRTRRAAQSPSFTAGRLDS